MKLRFWSTNKTLRLKVCSDSMKPLFITGDIVEIYKSKHIKPGDIICYINEKKEKVLHRAFPTKKKLYTKGDMNQFFDMGTVQKVIGVARTNESWLQKKQQVRKMRRLYKQAYKQED